MPSVLHLGAFIITYLTTPTLFETPQFLLFFSLFSDNSLLFLNLLESNASQQNVKVTELLTRFFSRDKQQVPNYGTGENQIHVTIINNNANLTWEGRTILSSGEAN